ncbi:MAG TPA: hypothetical protein VJR93_05290 [Chthoniobacterales bacterium]|nr:hypothetical protein [Chthoniobacterales bacterium]
MQKRTYVFVFVPIYVECAACPDRRANATPSRLEARALFETASPKTISTDGVPSEFPFWTWFIDNPRPQAKGKQ